MKTAEDAEDTGDFLEFLIPNLTLRPLSPLWFSFLFLRKIQVYFQLQLGCVLLPLYVNCFTLVPSANIVKT
jgi:hypothetical protein